MNKQILILGLSVLLVACSDGMQQSKPTTTKNASAIGIDQAALTEKAKLATQALGAGLKTALEAALKTGDPVNALSICNTQALAIANQVSVEQGIEVSRISLKNRNPNNAANAWQTKILNDFEARKATGENPSNLSYTAVVGDEFRFMKAIPTGEVCLACHGQTISPAVSAKLAELYPQDKATGYNAGDLRGAFVVVKNIGQ